MYKAVRKWVKEREPRNNPRYIGLKVSFHGSQYQYVRKGECVLTCRGLSPQWVDELFVSELGRTISLLTEASKKPKRRGGGMAIW